MGQREAKEIKREVYMCFPYNENKYCGHYHSD